MVTEEQEPRLYTKQRRVPVDPIPAHQADIHADLERWGEWNRERREQGTCESLEKNFDNRGGRRTRAPDISLPTDPMLYRIDRTVRLMTMRTPQHAEAIKLYYAQRRTHEKMCRLLVIHWEAFGRFMTYARAMVLNVMKELDS